MVLAAHQQSGFAVFWVVIAIVFALVFLGIKARLLTRSSMMPIVLGQSGIV
jgi:hypothetical protein